MDFGKVSHVTSINFAMPNDHVDNKELFSRLPQKQKIKISLGCPAWAEKNFIGKIYPLKTKNNEYLVHYSKHFSTIEFNSTYYAIPKIETIINWKEKVTSDFTFCPKIPAQISHEQQMINSEQTTAKFVESVQYWEKHLGMCFLVLPPNFSPYNSNILIEYVKKFPLPLAIEFRHPQWFHVNTQTRNIFKQLENTNTTMVITDVAGRRDCLHQRITSNTAMVRFVGNNLHESDYQRLDSWIERLFSWVNNGVSTVYFFIHQPQTNLAINAAIYFGEKLSEKLDVDIITPQLLQLDIQQTFF